MAILNMAKINTLIRKGYLLAGVVMAANMFVVNEMKAMENNKDNIEKEKNEEINGGEGKEGKKSGKKGFRGRLLYWENRINFFGGALFTLANSYYKFYENKPGFYFDYYFAGWNSNPFVKGYLQFCPNINLGRGGFWLIATFLGSYEYLKGKKSIIELKSTAAIIMTSVIRGEWRNDLSGKILFFFLSSLQGFVSMPLTLHLSNFSISISLDSMIWGIVGMILEPKDKKDLGEQIEKMIDEKKDDKQGEIKN